VGGEKSVFQKYFGISDFGHLFLSIFDFPNTFPLFEKKAISDFSG